MKFKEKIKAVLFRIYYPYIVRKEKYAAVKMWREGVRECEKMYSEIGSPRVYLLYDAKHMVWAPMTYEPNKKYKPSLRILRRMGKMHGMQSVNSVERMKQVSFYYTPSKWGALGCAEDNRVREEKLRQWLSYYMLRLSVPMRKVREYQQSRRPQCQSRPV